MNIDRHFHAVVTITHNCVVVTVIAASVRASHSRYLGATVGVIWLVFVYWLTGCFICLCICTCIWYAQDVSDSEF